MNNLVKYRKALIYVKELAKLEASMKNALADLESYKKYLPAQECIEVISRNLTHNSSSSLKSPEENSRV
jgi:hypothetical protein